MTTKPQHAFLSLTALMALTVPLVPGTAGATPPLWPSRACDNFLVDSRIECDGLSLHCRMAWTADATSAEGLETGWVCGDGDRMRFVVTDTSRRILLDSGGGVRTQGQLVDIIPGGYPEVLVSSYIGNGRYRTQIIFYAPTLSRYVSVYATEDEFEVTMLLNSEQVIVRIRDCDTVRVWSPRYHEFEIVPGEPRCTYEGDD